MLCRFIHRSIFCCSTSLPRTSNTSWPLSISTSFLFWRFRTIACISCGLTFLSLPHLLMRDRYCRSLQTRLCQHCAQNSCCLARTEATYSALKPYSSSIICLTLGKGSFCSMCKSRTRFLYGSQSSACRVAALRFRGRSGGRMDDAGPACAADADAGWPLPAASTLDCAWLGCNVGAERPNGCRTWCCVATTGPPEACTCRAKAEV